MLNEAKQCTLFVYCRKKQATNQGNFMQDLGLWENCSHNVKDLVVCFASASNFISLILDDFGILYFTST